MVEAMVTDQGKDSLKTGHSTLRALEEYRTLVVTYFSRLLSCLRIRPPFIPVLLLTFGSSNRR
jgi:hypothetical protein